MNLLRGVRRPGSAGALRAQIRKACLPTVPAVATISAAPATTTAASTAATAPASAAVPAASATTAAAALRLGTRFIHNEVSPAKILSIQGIDRAVCVFIVGNFDEGKTA